MKFAMKFALSFTIFCQLFEEAALVRGQLAGNLDFYPGIQVSVLLRIA